jgi:glycosyltransferase involved in cell wall biosynthesis
MNILLTFTFNYSLKTWEEAGILDRELGYYKKLSDKHNIKFVFLTYGYKSEKKYLTNYPTIEVIPIYDFIKPTNNKCLLFLKTFFVPFLIRKKVSDISIIKTNQLNGSWLAILLKLVTNKPLFIRTGYDAFLFSVKEKKSFIKRILFYLLTQLSLLVSNFYTVSSTDDYKFIIKNYIFKKSKLHVRQNWVKENNNIEFSERDKSKIISVGRLVSQKNYQYLINEFSNSEYAIDIVGTGPESEKLINQAKKSNTKVNFLGNLDNENLLKLLNEYKYFISTSLFEGNPKATLEAMSSGCIVFAVNIPNNSEIIRHEENGILYQTKEGRLLSIFEQVSNNDDLSNKLSKNAFRDSKTNFSMDKMIETEYQDLLNLSK